METVKDTEIVESTGAFEGTVEGTESVWKRLSRIQDLPKRLSKGQNLYRLSRAQNLLKLLRTLLHQSLNSAKPIFSVDSV